MINMPTREKIVGFALTEKRRVNHEEKTKSIATLRVFTECGK